MIMRKRFCSQEYGSQLMVLPNLMGDGNALLRTLPAPRRAVGLEGSELQFAQQSKPIAMVPISARMPTDARTRDGKPCRRSTATVLVVEGRNPTGLRDLTEHVEERHAQHKHGLLPSFLAWGSHPNIRLRFRCSC